MRVETVVNTLLKFASENNHQITHLKLQKLLYFLYGEYLARTGKLLIEEHFEAWQYGPVIPKVYDNYKNFGGNPLGQNYYPSIDLKTKEEKFFVVNDADLEFWETFNATWKKYGKLNAAQLSTLSHVKGSPWEQTKMYKAVISSELIKEYFLEENKRNVIYE